MKTVRAFFLATIFLINASQSIADETPCKPLRVVIEGAKRTKPRAILQTAQLEEGECAPSDLDAASIEKSVLDMRIFSEARATIEETDEAVIVKIVVKERFTPVPVPMLFATKEDMGGGIFLFDPNLFGMAKVFVAGATISRRGQRYQAMYLDDHVAGSRFMFFIRSVYGNNELKRFDGDEESYAFRQIFSQFIAAVGYHVTPDFSPSIGLLYRRQGTSRVDDYAPPPDDLLSPALVIDLRYKPSRKENYYERGFGASVSFDQALPMLGSQRVFDHIVANVEFATPLTSFILFRAELESGFGFGDQDMLTYFRLGGDVGSRGLPNRGLWVRDYASASVAVEEPLYRHKYGTLTSVQFFDAIATGEDDPVRTYPGVGIGLRIYLKELAIPAVGVDGAYSLWTENFRISAYVGKTF